MVNWSEAIPVVCDPADCPADGEPTDPCRRAVPAGCSESPRAPCGAVMNTGRRVRYNRGQVSYALWRGTIRRFFRHRWQPPGKLPLSIVWLRAGCRCRRPPLSTIGRLFGRPTRFHPTASLDFRSLLTVKVRVQCTDLGESRRRSEGNPTSGHSVLRAIGLLAGCALRQVSDPGLTQHDHHNMPAGKNMRPRIDVPADIRTIAN